MAGFPLIHGVCSSILIIILAGHMGTKYNKYILQALLQLGDGQVTKFWLPGYKCNSHVQLFPVFFPQWEKLCLPVDLFSLLKG